MCDSRNAGSGEEMFGLRSETKRSLGTAGMRQQAELQLRYEYDDEL